MNQQEAAAILLLARGVGMRVDPADIEATTTAWSLALEDLPFDDAKTALLKAAKAKVFLDVAVIVEETKRLRADRLAAFGPMPAPNVRGEDAKHYAAELAEMKKAIADGRFTRDMVPEYEASGRAFITKTRGIVPRPLERIAVDDGEVARGRAIGRGLGIPEEGAA